MPEEEVPEEEVVLIPALILMFFLTSSTQLPLEPVEQPPMPVATHTLQLALFWQKEAEEEETALQLAQEEPRAVEWEQ